MGTAHGADELGLYPHGLACQAGAWGRYIGFCLGYGHIWTKSKLKRLAKIFCEAHTYLRQDVLKTISIIALCSSTA
jgi:hypothetical protein